MNQDRQLRWAVLGTGVIANEMAAALRSLDARELRAMAEELGMMVCFYVTKLPDIAVWLYYQMNEWR